jgi:peptidylprolyl isomerase
MFHRVAAVVAVTTLTLLALGGCGGGTASTSSGGAPSVTGAYGNTPNLTIPTSAPPSELTSTLLSRGAGARVNRGDLLVANYLGQTWKARKEFDSSFRRGQPLAFPIGVGQVIKGWDTKLVGVPIGSRVLLVVPPADGYGSAGQPSAGIAGDDTLVFVVDVLGAYGGRSAARGSPAPVASTSSTTGLPRVTAGSGSGSAPVVEAPPKTAPPPSLVTVPLLRGAGPGITKGQLAVVQYVGVAWSTGKIFDSSWTKGAPASFVIGTGQVIAGWDESLTGATVGSRLLLVIPPGKGYGAEGKPAAGIKGGETLVFVIDVLGVH